MATKKEWSSGAAGNEEKVRVISWYLRAKDAFWGGVMIGVILVYWIFDFLPTNPTDYYFYSATHFLPLIALQIFNIGCKHNLTILKHANQIGLIQLFYQFSGIIFSDIQCYRRGSPSSCSGKYVLDLLVLLPITSLLLSQARICYRDYFFTSINLQ